MTSTTPPTNTATVTIVVAIVTSGAAFDVAGCDGVTSDAVTNGIAARAAGAGLSPRIGLGCVHLVQQKGLGSVRRFGAVKSPKVARLTLAGASMAALGQVGLMGVQGSCFQGVLLVTMVKKDVDATV